MTIRVGDILIDRVLEMQIPFLSPTDAFPHTPVAEAIEKHRHWLEPSALCPETGKLIIAIQTWIIRTPQHLILVDTCLGCDKTNHYFKDWHQRSDTRWYQALLAKGIDPAGVDYVFCTHLHGDHCGWNTRLIDGRWVPTFPNAKYIIAKAEVDHVASENTPAWQESVLPCIETGQVMAVDTAYTLNDQVWLEPALGHTPGHVSVNLQSKEQRAVLCGDLIHSPLQCLYPHWEYWIDFNPQQAVQTRKQFLETHSETNNLILTAHFPSPSMGFVEAQEDAFRFRFLDS